jgi:hypothetical protein
LLVLLQHNDVLQNVYRGRGTMTTRHDGTKGTNGRGRADGRQASEQDGQKETEEKRATCNSCSHRVE